MKISKEDRRLLSQVVQQEVTQMFLSNRAEKDESNRKEQRLRFSFKPLGFWKAILGAKRETVIRAAKAANTGT